MVNCILMLWTLAIAASPIVHSARILAMFPLGASSHHRFIHPVVTAMARAGHQVVMYSPFPQLFDEKIDNLTHVYLGNITVLDQRSNKDQMINDIKNRPFWKCLDLQWSLLNDLYTKYMSHTSIKDLLSSNERFDLILTETFNAQEFTLLLAHRFKAPMITLQAFPTHNILNRAFGNSLSISYIPDLCTTFSARMTIIERFFNAIAKLRGLYCHYFYYIPKVDKLLREDFPNTPPVEQLTKNLSLVFVNDHLTADYAQPRTPNIIPVAGIHIQPPRPLPQDIHKFMDEASDGVVFFSLGTYVLDDIRPQAYYEMYKNVFKNLKQKVLWKTRKENIEGLPSNVMIVKWAPQQDVLAHPNCRLFITHGGQLSKVEALHFGVPVISIPHLFDQHMNSEFYVQQGVGIRLVKEDVTEETLMTAINQVLYNTRYRENMKKLSAIFKDRPLSPAESVVFWTEYVLRHGGAAHLRPASTELRWYQLILLDVFTLLLAVISTFLILGYCSIRYCVKVFFSSRRKQMDVERKNK